MPKPKLGILALDSYPTPDEILGVNQTFKPGVLGLVRAWKKEWNNGNKADDGHKTALVQQLASSLSDLYGRPSPDVVLASIPFEEHGTYNPRTHTITLSPPVSILTSLHEIAHHLFGSSERHATIWSVHLFKRVWPKAFAKLEWRGHMLVKPTSMPKKVTKRRAPQRPKKEPPKAIMPASGIVNFAVAPMPEHESMNGNSNDCIKCENRCAAYDNAVVIMAISDKGTPIKGILCMSCAKAWAKATKKFWDDANAILTKGKKVTKKLAKEIEKLSEAALVEGDEEDARTLDEDDDEDSW